MSIRSHRIHWTCLAGVGALAGASFASDRDPSLNNRLASLEQELQQLRETRSQTSSWLSPDRSEEMAALMQELAEDANRRTSLLSANGNAGWDNGFYLRSDSGDFTLNIHVLAQIRAVWNIRDDASGQDGSIFGFDNRRTRIWGTGNLYGDELTYQINGDFGTGGVFTLLDAYIQCQLNEEWTIRFGQQKAPYTAEFLTHPSRLTTADYSWFDSLVGAGYIQGVTVGWQRDNMRVHASFTDGVAASLTGPNGGGANGAALAAGGTEYAFTARGEMIVAGDTSDWGRFKDFQGWSDEQYTSKLGAAVHWQDSEYGTAAVETELFGWTVDSHTELGGEAGLSVFAAAAGWHSNANMVGSTDFDQIGFLVQSGLFLQPDRLELFGRYEYYDFDGAVAAGEEDSVSLITFGANLFWQGHNKKWTNDIMWAIDPIPSAAGNAGIGLLPDSPNNENQIVLRSQVTLTF